MALLGYVISLKAGKDYETLVLERICRPLGMDSTCVTLTPELRSQLAVGHAMPGRPVVNEDFSCFGGAGGLYSTANDLLKFVSAEMGLTPSSLTPLMQKARAVHHLESGLNVRLAWFANSSNFSHRGDTYGYQADLQFDLQKRRGVVMLSNCARTGIIHALQGPLMNDHSLRPSGIVPVDPKLLDGYVGQYRTSDGAIIAARHEGKRFILRELGHTGERSRNFSFEVYPKSESVFSNKMWDAQATFVRGGQGITLTVSVPQGTLVATQISTTVPETPPPFRIDPKIYDDYVGRYRRTFLFGLFHLGPSFNIRRETDELGDHLVGYITGKHIDTYIPSLSGNLYGGEIFPESETVFFTPFRSDLRIRFDRNKNGKANHVVIDLGGSTIRAARVSDQPAK